MNNVEQRLEIKAAADGLPPGGTSNDIPCPWCKQAKSFSVTKTRLGDVLYLCHRASCTEGGRGGYIRERGLSSTSQVKREFTPRVYTGTTRYLEGPWLSQLVDAYRLAEVEIRWAGWLHGYPPDAIVMPVYSAYGTRRGVLTKFFDKSVVPKTLTYKEVDDAWMGWYIRSGASPQNQEGKYSTVVVVEDPISALKASRFYPAVSIYGTYLSPQMIEELTNLGDRIVLCFDRDATQKALDYAKNYAMMGNFRTVPLSKDVKDMTQQELQEWSELL